MSLPKKAIDKSADQNSRAPTRAPGVHNIGNKFTPPTDLEIELARVASRRRRYDLREAAAAALPDYSVARCGRFTIGGQATLFEDAEGRASWGGVETCHSVWHCPVCSSKIAAHRQREITDHLQAHAATGGAFYMVTLTAPHGQFDLAADTLDLVRLTWSKVIAGAPWKRARERLGIVGFIRSLEVTHGRRNGWHPHLHVVLAMAEPLPDDVVRDFGEWLFARWSDRIYKMNQGICSYAGYRFQDVTDPEKAAEYIAKEIALAPSKLARGDGSYVPGRTPFQILSDAAKGNFEDRALFRQYGEAFHGKRHISWSKGFRDLYATEPELTDEEIMALEPLRVAVAGFSSQQFRKIALAGMQSRVLETYEANGWQAVISLIRKL